MLICALDHPSSNLMVLAEDFKEEDAVYNIYLLHHRRQNIFLAYQQQLEPSLCTESPRWFYESVLQAVDQQGDQHVDKKLKTTIRIINTPMPTLYVHGSFVRSRGKLEILFFLNLYIDSSDQNSVFSFFFFFCYLNKIVYLQFILHMPSGTPWIPQHFKIWNLSSLLPISMHFLCLEVFLLLILPRCLLMRMPSLNISSQNI